jgi:hypothetical protein
MDIIITLLAIIMFLAVVGGASIAPFIIFDKRLRDPDDPFDTDDIVKWYIVVWVIIFIGACVYASCL